MQKLKVLKLKTKGSFWARIDMLIGVILTASIFCLIFALSHRAIGDPDIWVHLKTGEFILQNKIIPYNDIFSYTRQSMPWPSHRWLFQVTSYLIYAKWQAEGLVLFQSYITTLSFLVLLFMGLKVTKLSLEIAAFLLLTTYASITRFNIRPEMFSLLFFGIYLYLLRFQTDRKIIWLLLPIQVLWVNFHLYFFIGPFLVALFVFAEFLRRKIKFLPWSWKKRFALKDTTYKRLIKLFLFACLACLFNPRGFQMAAYPFVVFKEILAGESNAFRTYITELHPTLKELGKIGNYYSLLTVLCFIFMLINLKRLKIIEILLAGSFFIFGLTVRNISFSSFVAYTIIISYIAPTLNKISSKVKIKAPFKNMFGYLFRSSLAIILTVWIGFKINAVLNKGYYDFNKARYNSGLSGIDYRKYPQKAADFILENNIQGNIFNDFNSGAYLIYRFYPQRKVFIDGRTEVYGCEFFKEYSDFIEGDASSFKDIENKYDISCILLTMTYSSIPRAVLTVYKDPRWKLVFLDDAAVIFLKDSPANQKLINKHKIDLDNYSPPKMALLDLGIRNVEPSPFIKRAILFGTLGKYDLVILEAKEALRIKPDSFEAYRLIGKAYLKKGLYQQAFENFRSALLLSPRHPEILVSLAICFKELGKTESAINMLRGVIGYKGNYAPAYYELGKVYLTLKNPNEAIRFLNKAVKLSPLDISSHIQLGEALFEKAKISKDKSHLKKAKDELSKALELDSHTQEHKKEIEDKLKEVEDIKI
jgi:tetratricopeptide (TPR) repeat protein